MPQSGAFFYGIRKRSFNGESRFLFILEVTHFKRIERLLLNPIDAVTRHAGSNRRLRLGNGYRRA